MNRPAPDIAPGPFRRVLGLFATGVVAVTAVDPATGHPARPGREFLHRRLAEAAPGIGLDRSHEYHLATDQGGG